MLTGWRATPWAPLGGIGSSALSGERWKSGREGSRWVREFGSLFFPLPGHLDETIALVPQVVDVRGTDQFIGGAWWRVGVGPYGWLPALPGRYPSLCPFLRLLLPLHEFPAFQYW